jgi:hypothetical protein
MYLVAVILAWFLAVEFLSWPLSLTPLCIVNANDGHCPILHEFLLSAVEKLQNWQTLAGAIVASIAIFGVFLNTNRAVKHAERLETHRRSRKHAAQRAVLPPILAQISGYAQRSASQLAAMTEMCVKEALPAGAANPDLTRELPADTLRALADFIEYADAVDVTVIESTAAWIQIFQSRLESLISANHDPAGTRIVVRTQIEEGMIDAATIHAGVTSVFEYARRRSHELPQTLTWEDVRNALRAMGYPDDQHTRLYEIIAGRALHTSGPFERLTTEND